MRLKYETAAFQLICRCAEWDSLTDIDFSPIKNQLRNEQESIKAFLLLFWYLKERVTNPKALKGAY